MTFDLVVVDYGMGNLHSVGKALERAGGRPHVTGDPDVAARAARLVLPGVGAFADAIAQLRRTGLDQVVLAHLAAERPFLGICLGLQMLGTTSEEDGLHQGLGVIPGACVRFQPPAGEDGRPLRVPHMGWNEVRPIREVSVLRGIPPGTAFYFVHSYHLRPESRDDVAADTDYGGPFCSMVQRGTLVATQFHPEKSQSWGLKLLENWLAL
jgi:glutamine amidotransferase